MTYSIVAADMATREAGGAGTSCLEGQDVYVIYQAAPGHGVVHAQAYYNAAGRRRAAELLMAGESPSQILASITGPEFDEQAEIRQYGIVDVLGRSAGFTGAGATAYAADRQGHVGTFAYSVQGNILTSERVLSQAASAFEVEGCDLAERLMRALEAGADGGEGDSRCTASGIPSDSAFLQVEKPDGTAGYLSLRVESSGRDNPLPQLRQKLDAWRASHPCPVASTSDSAAADAGCSCALPREPDHAGAWLFCGLAVVAWWRQRASRQLRPILPA